MSSCRLDSRYSRDRKEGSPHLALVPRRQLSPTDGVAGRTFQPVNTLPLYLCMSREAEPRSKPRAPDQWLRPHAKPGPWAVGYGVRKHWRVGRSPCPRPDLRASEEGLVHQTFLTVNASFPWALPLGWEV